MKKIVPIILLLLTVQCVLGQEMITNYLSKEGDKGSYPKNFVEFNHDMYFQATTETSGQEIWKMDGNTNEISILKDINPGNNNGITSSLTSASVILNNSLYFNANDGNSDGEIWKTDGTRDGTSKVTSFLNTEVSQLTLVNNRFFFLMQHSSFLQLWVSDGTSDGTRIAKDSLYNWNEITFQGKYNDLFVFTFQPKGSNQSKVWRSDGTSDGTFPITDEIDGNGSVNHGTSGLSQFIEFNDELYFVSRYSLYKSDGTYENTVPITTVHDCSNDFIEYADVVAVNDKLYFSFFDLDYYRLFIWESDGTSEGTKKVYDQSGSRYYTTSNLLAGDNSIIFCGSNNSGGTSLISMNLNDYNLTYIKELQDTLNVPRFSFSNTRDLCKMNYLYDGKLFCSSPTRSNLRKHWISELTAETTSVIQSLSSSTLFNFNNGVYFAMTVGDEGTELWTLNEDKTDPVLVKNINTSKNGITVNQMLSINSQLLFSADGSVDGKDVGEELWTYNGNNVSILKDIMAGSTGSYCKSYTYIEDKLYFLAYDSIHGIEIWKTDGTESGTTIVYDIIEGRSSTPIEFLTAFKDEIYFFITERNNYHIQLYKTEGDTIEFVKDLGVNSYNVPYEVINMKACGNYLYFVAYGAGEDLWISDGTENGTYKLNDLGYCQNLTNVNGRLFFSGSQTYKGDIELWSVNTPGDSATLVKNINIESSSDPADFINYNGVLFFSAFTSVSGREIWKSDGTANGTVQIADINPGTNTSILEANFTISNNTLFFAANDGSNGYELWKTTGEASTTKLVKDINTGSSSSFPSQIVAINDSIYFQAYEAEYGYELWKSDGANTEMVFDLLPGIFSSYPTNIIAISNNVFFVAESEDYGRQIWKIEYDENTSKNVVSKEDIISIYPNPCSNELFINTQSKINEIYLFTADGKQVLLKTSSYNILDLSELPKGIYLLKINTDGQWLNRKIIKL